MTEKTELEEIFSKNPKALKAFQDEIDKVISNSGEKFHAQMNSIIADRDALRREVDAAYNLARVREKELLERVKELESRSSENQKELYDRQARFENLSKQQRAELERRSAELNTLKEEAAREKELYEEERARLTNEAKENIKATSSTFVANAIKELNKKYVSFSRIALSWAMCGGVVLVFSIALLSWISLLSLREVNSNMDWPLLSFYALKGTVIIGLTGVMARYSFILSGNYMREALRTSDRIHAIKFGQFYVETYGAAADWANVKGAFSKWHADNSSTWENTADNSLDQTHSNIVSQIIEKIKS